MELGNKLFTPGDTGTFNWLNPDQQGIAEEVHVTVERFVYKT